MGTLFITLASLSTIAGYAVALPYFIRAGWPWLSQALTSASPPPRFVGETTSSPAPTAARRGLTAGLVGCAVSLGCFAITEHRVIALVAALSLTATVFIDYTRPFLHVVFPGVFSCAVLLGTLLTELARTALSRSINIGIQIGTGLLFVVGAVTAARAERTWRMWHVLSAPPHSYNLNARRAEHLWLLGLIIQGTVVVVERLIAT
jgi:hypothetical protein